MEIMQDDFQSSGIFCFCDHKAVFSNLCLNFWGSSVSVGGYEYIKILCGQRQTSQGFTVISSALETQVGFNY